MKCLLLQIFLDVAPQNLYLELTHSKISYPDIIGYKFLIGHQYLLHSFLVFPFKFTAFFILYSTQLDLFGKHQQLPLLDFQDVQYFKIGWPYSCQITIQWKMLVDQMNQSFCIEKFVFVFLIRLPKQWVKIVKGFQTIDSKYILPC